MNIKTNLLKEYVNYVDTTKKQNKYYKTKLFLFGIRTVLFLFFVLFENSSK